MPHTDATPTLLPNPPLPPTARGSKKNAATGMEATRLPVCRYHLTRCGVNSGGMEAAAQRENSQKAMMGNLSVWPVTEYPIVR
jgi:hypothetical protein